MKKRFSEEQIIGFLREDELGMLVHRFTEAVHAAAGAAPMSSMAAGGTLA